MSQRYDVIIVGAGISGAALACALARAHSQLRIALLEAQPLREGWPPINTAIDGFDARVSALTTASCQLLEQLEDWPEIASRRVSPFRDMLVWDAEGTGQVHFEAADVRAEQLGFIVENRLIVAALVNSARQLAAIDIIDAVPVAGIRLPGAAAVTALEPDDELSQITLDDGRQLLAPLVVAADGANSVLRRQLDMPVREWDYQQNAIVCTVQLEQSHQSTAWQRFTPTGPLAFLPLSGEPEGGESDGNGSYCSIIWSQHREQAEALMQLDDEAFREALARNFERRLGDIVGMSKRFSFPLMQRHAVDYVLPGFALVADAAHAIHPLAGQGINLGLADVRVLSDCVLAAVARGQSAGDLAVLRRYQRQRKGDNLAMMAAVEAFKRAFEQQPLPLHWLRNTGMNWFDRQRGLKNRVIKYAMGIE